jgi:hypothetical protein
VTFLFKWLALALMSLRVGSCRIGTIAAIDANTFRLGIALLAMATSGWHRTSASTDVRSDEARAKIG